MGVWIRCRICATEIYIDQDIRSKKLIFEYGYWECCEFARLQKYMDKPRLEFDFVRR